MNEGGPDPHHCSLIWSGRCVFGQDQASRDILYLWLVCSLERNFLKKEGMIFSLVEVNQAILAWSF